MPVYDDQRTEEPLVDDDIFEKPDDSEAKDLANQEENPDSSDQDDSATEDEKDSLGGLYKSGSDTSSEADEPGFYTGKGASSAKGSAKGGFLKRLRKKKLVLAAGLGSGLLIIAIVAIIAMFGSLKIIQLAENITVYNMARAARTMRMSQTAILEENVASETITNSRIAALKQRFNETKLGEAVKFFNDLRPQRIFNNLNRNFEPVYTTTGKNALGFDQKTLQGFNYTQADGSTTFIQKADQKFLRPFQNSTNRVQFAAEFEALMEKDLQGYKPWVRNSALKKLLRERGIELKWWDKLGKGYQGLKENAAARLAQSETYQRVNNPEGSCTVTKVCQAAKEAEETAAKTLKEAADENATGGAKAVEEKVNSARASTLATAVEETGLEKTIGFLSSTYAVALPLCLVYEGSIEHAGGMIDNNSTALEREYFAVRSAADQQKAGDTTGEAVGGFSDKIGDISNSVPELKASGKNITASNYINPMESPQASSTGTFSLLNVVFGDGAVMDLMNRIFENGCGFMTDIKTGIALTGAEWLLTLFTGGGVRGGTAAVEAGTKTFTTRLVEKLLFSGLRTKIKEQGVKLAVVKPAERFILKTGLLVGATIGMTELAKMAVLKHMGAANDGLATDDAFANQAYMGGEIYAQNEVGKQTLYGRPMTTPEVAQSTTSDIAYVSKINSQKSFGERYFALTNPQSLFSKIGRAGYGLKSGSGILNRVISNIGSVLANPSSALSMFGKPRLAQAAAGVSGAGDFNIIQWGWPDDEMALIRNYPDQFSPMINKLTLDASGRAGDIESKFGKCFSASVGSLLQDKSIQREVDGAVMADQGLCSPNNLGPNNNEFGPQMVFRWRLSKLNESMYNHLLEIQNPSEEATTAGASSISSPQLNGYTIPCQGQPAAVKRLPGPKADWTGVRDSGTLGNDSAGQPIKVYIRAACNSGSAVRTVVVVGSIHGTENGGQLVAWELLFNAKLPPDVQIVAVPEYNKTGVNLNQRKNKNGVDLNRNTSFNWSSTGGKSCSEYDPGCEFYHGSAADSEPETKSLEAFLLQIGKANLSLFYHDNLNYVAPVGSTALDLAAAYGSGTGMKGKNGPYSTVSQHGSIDGWYNQKTSTPTLLVELSSDQSEAVVNRHVTTITNMLQNGAIK